MVVRQSDSAARYGLIFSVLIIGAIIAEPVIIAVVPEPCGKRMMTPMMIGTKIPGTPAATIASAIIFAAPVALITAPRAPPAAVMNTIGPASRQASCIRSTQVLRSYSAHRRNAPMQREINSAITGCPRNFTHSANAVP